MALTVEDGGCVPDADSFVSLSDANTYFTEYGGAWSGDDADKEAALRRASSWLSSFVRWDGSMTCGRGLQGLAWPRTGVDDCNGDDIPDDEVPVEVKRATYAAALVELTTPGTLTPSITPGQQVKRNKVDVIEQEFMTPKDQGVPDGSFNPATALRPLLTQVEDYIRCLGALPNGPAVPWPIVV